MKLIRPDSYRAWIEAEDALNVGGLCRVQAEKMLKVFPELRLARGFYGSSHHWWCVGPDDAVWDPTYKQFEYAASYRIVFTRDPVGKCLICGAYVWDYTFSSSACSADCEAELRVEYGSYSV